MAGWSVSMGSLTPLRTTPMAFFSFFFSPVFVFYKLPLNCNKQIKNNSPSDIAVLVLAVMATPQNSCNV